MFAKAKWGHPRGEGLGPSKIGQFAFTNTERMGVDNQEKVGKICNGVAGKRMV